MKLFGPISSTRFVSTHYSVGPVDDGGRYNALSVM